MAHAYSEGSYGEGTYGHGPASITLTGQQATYAVGTPVPRVDDEIT